MVRLWHSSENEINKLIQKEKKTKFGFQEMENASSYPVDSDKVIHKGVIY
jgi:hypothetical protein